MSLEFCSEANSYTVYSNFRLLGSISFCYGGWYYCTEREESDYLYSYEELDIISSKLKELNS